MTQCYRTVSVIEMCSVLNVVYNRNEVKRGGNITLETDCYLNSRKNKEITNICIFQIPVCNILQFLQT